ncbi:VasL domain-containing protein [Yersinia massiliensis]|uniref:VasL domain-containing protein n=1 Tax=Yersinia massiliensis TaxID=419257 RepID=UPI0016439F10|nr:VasL domain-containing protein [Yersinia massiliensis]MCB5309644.1 type VI secretion system ImpA family N-terminal domain-containing protein [Yersinia massiliensis]
MKSTINLAALKINYHDPRYSKSFLLLSSELNRLNSSNTVNLDWAALENRCHQIFQQDGYDLQSGVWFCLINTKQHGWQGLAQAVDLLAEAFGPTGVRCWPAASAEHQRRGILEWFNAYVGSLIYILPQGIEYIPLMQRVEVAMALLCQQANLLQSRIQDPLNNLRYFLQVRSRTMNHMPMATSRLPEAQSETPQAKAAVATLTNEALRQGASLKTPAGLWWHYMPSALTGLLLGVVLTLAVVGGYLYRSPSLTNQLIAPIGALRQYASFTTEGWPTATAAQWNKEQLSIISNAEQQLNWLSALPPQFPWEQGEQISRQLNKVYPDNPASQLWQRRMQEKTGDALPLGRWLKLNADIDHLEQRLLNSEKNRNQFMTVSELKTAVYQLRRDLYSGGLPAEALLGKLEQHATAGEAISPALVKQIEQSLSALIARYVSLLPCISSDHLDSACPVQVTEQKSTN